MPRFLKAFLITGGVFLFIGLVTATGGFLWLNAHVPPITALTHYQPNVPLRIHARDGRIIGEFGSETRYPLAPEAIPHPLKTAFLAAEDASFFDHPGIDIPSIIRALIVDIQAGAPVQGASTITQQVARTFLLSQERTIIRKLREMILAFRIERRLTKPEILHLYLNQIYLGNGAYGVEAAAQIYYDKSVRELTLAEMAMIAGLPKAPTRFNPTMNPERARSRRGYVLRRLVEIGAIASERAKKAQETPIHAGTHTIVDAPMPLVAEEVRRRIVERYGEEQAYTAGLRVFTSIDPESQANARRALQEGLLDYTYRHGYRGPAAHIDLEPIRRKTQSRPQGTSFQEVLRKRLATLEAFGPLRVGVVLRLTTPKEGKTRHTDSSPKSARVLLANGHLVDLPWQGMRWARPYRSPNRRGPQPETASDILAPGDVIRLEKRPGRPWHLSQPPRVQGAMVAMAPQSGRIRAMIGSFDVRLSEYNRATQARRQPGSAFKPFIYAAALNKGRTPATLINDAPIVFENAALGTRWRPQNYSRTFHGPTRLRTGLEHSRNLVTIRLLRQIGVNYAVDFASRFGFNPEHLPHNLALSLGAASLTPIQMVRGYAVFANGGLRVDPVLIERVEDRNGHPLKRRTVRSRCIQCHRASNPSIPEAETLKTQPEERFHAQIRPERVLTPQIRYQMVSLLQGVVQRGTGRRAKHLDYPVAGKTGTSNDQRNAWFLGFTRDLVAGVFVGFDKPRTLGHRETGSRAAAPLWVDFMERALQNDPSRPFQRPKGLVSVRIDSKTGKLAAPWSEDTQFELFRKGNAPDEVTPPSTSAGKKAKGMERGMERPANQGAGQARSPDRKEKPSRGPTTQGLF